MVKFIKANLLHKTKNSPSNSFQKLTFIKHKIVIYFNYFYLYLYYPICLFFIFLRLLGKTFFHHRCRTPSSAARKAASVNEPTFRVRCNVCSASRYTIKAKSYTFKKSKRFIFLPATSKSALVRISNSIVFISVKSLLLKLTQSVSKCPSIAWR